MEDLVKQQQPGTNECFYCLMGAQLFHQSLSSRSALELRYVCR